MGASLIEFSIPNVKSRYKYIPKRTYLYINKKYAKLHLKNYRKISISYKLKKSAISNISISNTYFNYPLDARINNPFNFITYFVCHNEFNISVPSQTFSTIVYSLIGIAGNLQIFIMINGMTVLLKNWSQTGNLLQFPFFFLNYVC